LEENVYFNGKSKEPLEKLKKPAATLTDSYLGLDLSIHLKCQQKPNGSDEPVPSRYRHISVRDRDRKRALKRAGIDSTEKKIGQ
jgi:hypothetical protein